MKKIYFLMMALVLGALTGYAKDAQQGCKIYFDATGWNAQVVQFCIGHDTWTATYEMSKIDNTNLYYYEFAEKWGGYNYFAVIGAGEKWGDGNWSVDNLKNAPNYTAPQLDYDLNAESYSISQTGNNTINTAWLENGYESLNYAQKVEGGEGGSVVAASFALNSNNTTEATEGTEIKAALTATVSCVAAPAEGYLFDGWYSGEDKVAESAEYEYVCKAANTLTAKFKVDPATAIESIEAENAPVEYYNLQGVKVANPENGLFIKKQGNKAVKVIL